MDLTESSLRILAANARRRTPKFDRVVHRARLGAVKAITNAKTVAMGLIMIVFLLFHQPRSPRGFRAKIPGTNFLFGEISAV